MRANLAPTLGLLLRLPGRGQGRPDQHHGLDRCPHCGWHHLATKYRRPPSARTAMSAAVRKAAA